MESKEIGKYPVIKVEPPGPRALAIIKEDKRLIMQSFARWYPLVVKKAYGSLVEDVDGNVYIDFNSGIAVMNVGHSHPRIVKAVARQVEKLIHYSLTDFYYEEAVEAARLLTSIAPISGAKVFFTNSGTESVEGAIKVARGFFKGARQYLISFIGGFHGRTYGSMSASASKSIHRKHFGPLLPGFIHVPYPNPYRCPFKGVEGSECGDAVIEYIEDYLFMKLVDPEEVAGFIVEPILGEGGYVVPPDNFLPSLRRLASKYGFLLIVDEVQTGFGRTGKMFAVEHWAVEPDIMALAKAMGGGLPLGAIVGRRDVMSLPPGSHANTFGGNPVALSAFKEVVSLILEERLYERAAKLGDEALKFLKEIQDSTEIVGDVRGKGLMIGVELVKDKATKKPAVKELREVLEKCFKRGLLVIGAGLSTVRIAPPLTIDRELFIRGLEILGDVIKEVDREAKGV